MDIEEVVKDSLSFRDLGRRLGITHRQAKALVEAHGLDVSHYTFGKRSLSYVGRTFGELTVVGVFKSSTDQRWMCSFRCVCGTEGVKRLDGVINLRVPSCGCLSRNRPAMLAGGNPAFKGCGELRAVHVFNIKTGAVRRNIPFKLSQEYLWQLFLKQDRRCALSGMTLTFGRVHFAHETTASLDRKDSSKGYVKGNVQWVHKDINRIKGSFGQEYFISLCQAIGDWSKRVDEGRDSTQNI